MNKQIKKSEKNEPQKDSNSKTEDPFKSRMTEGTGNLIMTPEEYKEYKQKQKSKNTN